jgi:hypothetical protein
MAKAAITRVPVVKTVTAYDDQITLTLSSEEARTIWTLVGNVSGDNVHSPRKHADSVHDALSSIFGFFSIETEEYALRSENLVNFRNYSSQE